MPVPCAPWGWNYSPRARIVPPRTRNGATNGYPSWCAPSPAAPGTKRCAATSPTRSGFDEDLQPHGQRDKRDFDNLVWTLPIPEYDPADALHRDLAAAASRAEAVAATVPLDAGHFTMKRRAIRAALAADGVAAEMEALVDALLPP